MTLDYNQLRKEFYEIALKEKRDRTAKKVAKILIAAKKRK